MTHSTADLDMRDHLGMPPRSPDLKCINAHGCIDPETCRTFGNGRGCADRQTGAELLYSMDGLQITVQRKPELTEPDWPT